MEEVRGVEVSEKDEKSEESLLELASKDIMTVLRESRENIQGVLPHVLERLDIRRLQETLKHEVEEATYISIQNVLRKSLEDVLLKVFDEKIEKAVERAFTEVVTQHLREKSIKEHIVAEIKRKLADFIDDQVYELKKLWREEGILETLKDRVKEQVLKEISDEVVKELRGRVLRQVKEEKPILAEALAELGSRISSLESQIHLLQSQIYELRGR